MNYVPLIHKNMGFSSNSHAIFFFWEGGVVGGGNTFYIYVWVYLSDKDTCQIRHISLIIHRGTYKTGNNVFFGPLYMQKKTFFKI